jgi:UDP-2,3-diacylglucosamine pyrophosphatase LpxH
MLKATPSEQLFNETLQGRILAISDSHFGIEESKDALVSHDVVDFFIDYLNKEHPNITAVMLMGDIYDLIFGKSLREIVKSSRYFLEKISK